jgi:sec-independent protein translocase protein TatC
MWLLFEAGLIFAPLFKRKENQNPEETPDDEWDDEQMEAEMDKIDAEMEALDKEE